MPLAISSRNFELYKDKGNSIYTNTVCTKLRNMAERN